MEKIFVDANFFIALFNPEDTLHARAVPIAKTLETQRISLVVSNFIFSETITVLSQRGGKPVAVCGGTFFLADSSVEIVSIDETLQEESWRIFQEIERKDTSFVDCSTLAVMRAEHIDALLTFDREDFAPMRGRYRFKFFEERAN